MKKILILYGNQGAGHRFNAELVEKILAKYPQVQTCRCTCEELVQTRDVDWISPLWNALIRHNCIGISNFLFDTVTRLVILPLLEVSHSERLFQALDRISPDAIVSTADGYNKALGDYAREKTVPFFIWIPEASTYADAIHPAAVHFCYFSETARAVREYDLSLTRLSFPLNGPRGSLRKLKYVWGCYRDHLLSLRPKPFHRRLGGAAPKLNDMKCVTLGPLAGESHFSRVAAEEAKARLGIPAGAPAVTVVSGSIGGRLLENVVCQLRKCSIKDLRVMLICGSDRQLFRRLQVQARGNNGLRLLPFAYVQDLECHLAASDFAIVRPSARVVNECLAARTPMISFALSTNNDQGALELMRKYGLGEVCRRMRDLPVLAAQVYHKNAQFRANIAAFLSNYPASYREMTWRIEETLLKSLGLRQVCLPSRTGPEEGGSGDAEAACVGLGRADSQLPV